ncbi:hypothetical protein TNIN_430951 [Trichonephila inaurata madagascariensis]|uniref:Uncharacterized protein n=1 Tax=Trichonephila inaurata madagascariensis TaxID=2747483 RepID=A0A8X7BYD7_9ARAC|nr:hypothetical protein TNIN_430951 [Trichonephila inaurata madagascariensis]
MVINGWLSFSVRKKDGIEDIGMIWLRIYFSRPSGGGSETMWVAFGFNVKSGWPFPMVLTVFYTRKSLMPFRDDIFGV